MSAGGSSATPARGVVLAMDAAMGDGTIALLRDGALVGSRDVVMRSDRDEIFFPALLGLLADCAMPLHALDGIVVGAGPGSFTALRVVGATAKGIAHARGLPVFAVSSLALTVAADASTAAAGTRWFSTLDALRGECYAALVSVGAEGVVTQVEHLGLVRADAVAERAAELEALPIGPDAAHRARPHARGVQRCLALAAVAPVDLATWEPLYGRLAEAQVKWEAAHGRPLG